jgi:pimeloyl-ACP methyl ester carboxylesterase
MKKAIGITVAMIFLLWAGRIFCEFPDPSATREVTFTAQCDGTEQKYVLLFPPSFTPDTPHDVLIALHGHGSDRWQFIRDGRDECRAARDFAAEHHMLYVSPDYRASTSWMGPKAEADVVQIIAELKDAYAVSRVFLCGASMGVTASLTFAALHPDLLDGVASMNGTANFLEYERFQEAISQSFGGTKTEIPEEYKKRSAEFWPKKFTMPTAFAVSGLDSIVPPDSVLRLAKTLKSNGGKVKCIYRKKIGHVTEYKDAQAILEFVRKNARKEDGDRESGR